MRKSHITIVAVIFVFVIMLITAQNVTACDNILVVNEGTPYEEQFHLCDKLYNANIYECSVGELRIYSNCECGELLVNSTTGICDNCEAAAIAKIETKEKLRNMLPVIAGLMVVSIICFTFAAIRKKNESKDTEYYNRDLHKKGLSYILGSSSAVMIISGATLPFLMVPILMFISI